MKKLCQQTSVLAIALLTACSALAQSSTQKTTTTPPAPAGTAATKNSGHASETVEYKDPEDMTTRYRPGNNKTTSAPATAPASQPATAAGKATQASGAKQPSIPACDGASKNAAKCAAAPPASGTPAAKHVNKVDSFTVKQ
jgi:hypothetical protein